MHHSERLILDIPQTSDFGRYYEINADPGTNLFNPRGPMDFETANERFTKMLAAWKEHHFSAWAIREKGLQTIIGFGGLSYLMYGNDLRLNVGYRFDKAHWGKGYATELTEYSIQFGFNELKKDQIFALVRPNHLVSIKVLEKCNMKLFGKLDDVPGQEQSLVYVIEK